jgi:(2R)-sulfolactate sulfo-lyase subunit alpha
MIHFVLHDAKDTVAVVVVEGVKAGMSLNGWIMDEDKMINPGDTVWKYGIDMGKVVAPIKTGGHAHVQNIKTKRW